MSLRETKNKQLLYVRKADNDVAFWLSPAKQKEVQLKIFLFENGWGKKEAEAIAAFRNKWIAKNAMQYERACEPEPVLIITEGLGSIHKNGYCVSLEIREEHAVVKIRLLTEDRKTLDGEANRKKRAEAEKKVEEIVDDASNFFKEIAVEKNDNTIYFRIKRGGNSI